MPFTVRLIVDDGPHEHRGVDLIAEQSDGTLLLGGTEDWPTPTYDLTAIRHIDVFWTAP